MTKKIFLLSLLTFLFNFAQVKTNYKLVMLPFSTKCIDNLSVKTAESIRKLEIKNQSSKNLIPDK